MNTETLGPSTLGTKKHWDDVYESEVNAFKNYGDEGEVWFGKATSLRMIDYLKSYPVKPHEPIIDLGCGNGMLLIDACKSGFTNLLGVDYSSSAIQLASMVTKSKGYTINFEVQDVTNWTGPTNTFSAVLDKGTYDAISLNPDDAVTKRLAYIDVVYNILAPGGLIHVATLPSPTFTFSGKSGSRTTIAAFKKHLHNDCQTK